MMQKIARILLPVDFSPGSQAAVDLALHLARELGASITLLHALQPASAMAGIVPGAKLDEDTAEERRTLETRLAEIAADLRAQGATVAEGIVVVGPPTRTILERARAGGFDLIAMGTHGRTGLPRLLLGSVAEHVVRHAECPVVTVHLPAARPGG